MSPLVSAAVLAPADRRWLLRQAVFMLVCAGLLLLVFENTGLDLMLARPFYDPAAPGFPLQHHWLFSDVMHHGLKTASYVLGAFSVMFCIYAWRKPVAWLPRRQALLAGLGVILIPLLTNGLKHLTNRHCPWDVLDFGGFAPYVSLFGTTSPDIVRGVCFPAGHASAGFVWIVWALVLRATRPVWARRALLLALLAGATMGFGRMAQGAHFLSHVLWSAWFAWSLSLCLAALLRVPLSSDPA